MSWVLVTGLLENSWVVAGGVVSRISIVIALIRGVMTLLITTHEPPSRVATGGLRVQGSGLAQVKSASRGPCEQERLIG